MEQPEQQQQQQQKRPPPPREAPITKPLPTPPPPRAPRAPPVVIDLPECASGGGRELRRRNTGAGSGDDGRAGALGAWHADSGSDGPGIGGGYGSAGAAGEGVVRVVERHHHHHHYFVPAEAGGDALLEPPGGGPHRGSTPLIEEYEGSDGEDGGGSSDGEGAGEWAGLPAGAEYGDFYDGYGDEGDAGVWGTKDRVLEEFYRRHAGLRPIGAGSFANPVPQAAFQSPTIANHCAWICSCILYCGILFCLAICLLIFFGIVTVSQVFGDPW